MAPGAASGRGIDHLVLCVDDLEGARAAYADLGFTLTPPARHPFGTANALVQLRGCFLELLAVADPARIVETEADRFSFAAFNRDFLERGQGMSMLVFDSTDARRDAADFAAAGLTAWQPFDFERTARLPDGGEATVGFSLAFATSPAMPRAAFFTCQQHAPQHFWKPDYQVHANTALGIAEVVMVAHEPDEHRDFFTRMMGADAVYPGADGRRLDIRTARGRLAVLDGAGWDRRFPDIAAPDLADGPRFAAYSVAVADFAAAGRTLAEGGAATGGRDRLIVPPERAYGVTIEFAAAMA